MNDKVFNFYIKVKKDKAASSVSISLKCDVENFVNIQKLLHSTFLCLLDTLNNFINKKIKISKEIIEKIKEQFREWLTSFDNLYFEILTVYSSIECGDYSLKNSNGIKNSYIANDVKKVNSYYILKIVLDDLYLQYYGLEDVYSNAEEILNKNYKKYIQEIKLN